MKNSDILDDKDYPKLYHRHSTIMMTTPDSRGCDRDARIRRYSDTKLLHSDPTGNTEDDGLDDDGNDVYMNETYNHHHHHPMPIFNVANVLGASIPTTSECDAHTENYQITDIIFDSNATGGGTYDPLELNIQEMLELDMATSRNALGKWCAWRITKTIPIINVRLIFRFDLQVNLAIL